MRHDWLRCIALSLCLLATWHGSVFGQDATANLFVCHDQDGMDTIIPQANLPAKHDHCKPYAKGMFGGQKAQSSNVLALPSPSAPQTDGQVASENNLGSLAQPIPLGQSAQSDSSLLSPSTSSSVASAKDSLGNSTSELDSNSAIYMCPKSNGTHEVVEAKIAPDKNCIVFQAPETQEASNSNESPNPPVNPITKDINNASAQIALPSSPPQDIYKCFDHMGRASYVGASEQHKFKQCSFFSRSFAGAQQEFKHKTTQSHTLAELAATGVSNDIRSNAALRCTGAGKIEYNGQIKEYNCASRSFNFSPGSTGGSVELGDQRATIAAHRLDYFDNAGSCGGTVLADNGRVLHLQPTKECPESFKIEARRIAKMVEKSLSIQVSGAFKERQRALAVQINQIAREVGVDPFLIHAVISAESAYKSKAVSHAGAQGLMQLMPATADRFGVTDPFHTGQNIRGGTTYLKWLLKEFNGNLELAIAGYNAGEGNVRKYGYKIPPFIETRAYVPKVLEYYRRYRTNPAEVGL